MLWRRLMLLLALLPMAACPPRRDAPATPRVDAEPASTKPKQWPALPWAEDRAEALIRERTRRPGRAVPTALNTAPELLELIKVRAREGKLVAGWAAVMAWLQARLDAAGKRDAYLLWGTYHDSGGQVASYRRVTGPQGLRRLSVVTAEQYAADGRWRGVEPDEQHGDSAALARYLNGGTREDLETLRRGQLDHDHTAWKYRYLHEVLDLAVAARAGGLRLVGCDMPKPLQRRLYSVSKAPKHLPALRELHCLLHLDDALTERPRRVAMLWGQSHVEPGGLPRFLPKDDVVIAVRVVGQRPGPHGVAFELGRAGLRIVDPLLVPVRDGAGMVQAALILPDRATRAQLHRARDVGAKAVGVTVQSSGAGTLTLGGQVRVLKADAPKVLTLPPGAHAFVLQSKGIVLAGGLEVRGGVTLSLQPEAKPPVVELTWQVAEGSAKTPAGEPEQ